MRIIRLILDHPLTDLFVSVVLIVTALSEDWHTLYTDLVHFDAGVHHGVLVLGVVSLLKTIPDLLDAAERIYKVRERAG
ncbi:hypothetical protein D3OALGA1CA_5799 [Olavius algarvensis associated proteobacterium Delta 3]|nr:hypothetical protein D3OALGB2SA_1226 [Olavius algarvensis associated proteobacterium Delta 3]CAB5172008.1 hypothetical protein D3OALGA1CA_5799 [Olavius algarvensis associated proteobacterium Delta 3]